MKIVLKVRQSLHVIAVKENNFFKVLSRQLLFVVGIKFFYY